MGKLRLGKYMWTVDKLEVSLSTAIFGVVWMAICCASVPTGWCNWLSRGRAGQSLPIDSLSINPVALSFRDHLHFFVGQSSPSSSSNVFFSHVSCQFIFVNIFPGVGDPSPPRPPLLYDHVHLFFRGKWLSSSVLLM